MATPASPSRSGLLLAVALVIVLALGIGSYISTTSTSRVVGMDCSALDPRTEVSTHDSVTVDGRVSAGAAALLGAAKAGGDVEANIRKELLNIQRNSPLNDSATITAKTIYMACILLLRATDIGTEQKVHLYNAMVSVRAEKPKPPTPAGDPPLPVSAPPVAESKASEKTPEDPFKRVKREISIAQLGDGIFSVRLTLRNGMTNALYIAADNLGEHGCSAELSRGGITYRIVGSKDCPLGPISHSSWGYSKVNFLNHIKQVGMTLASGEKVELTYRLRASEQEAAPPPGSTTSFCAALAIAYVDGEGKPVARRQRICPDTAPTS